MDDQTIGECMIGHGSVLQLVIDQKKCLCPKGVEQEEMQTGVPLDTVLRLYVNRLSDTAALNKLLTLVRSGAVAASELIAVHAEGGTAVPGKLGFEGHTRVLSFEPLAPLQPRTLYTVTLKSDLMAVKKEIADLCLDGRPSRLRDQPLRGYLDHPVYTFTFTTCQAAWRKLKVYQRIGEDGGQIDLQHAQRICSSAPAAYVTLKNEDEVFDGLKVMCAQMLPGDLDEDEDIMAIHLVTIRRGQLQLSEVTHANMGMIEDNNMLLVTLRPEELDSIEEEELELEAEAEPPIKRQCVEDNVNEASQSSWGILTQSPKKAEESTKAAAAEAAAAAATAEAAAARMTREKALCTSEAQVEAVQASQSSSSAGAGNSSRPAKERLSEVKDLLDGGLISQEDFEKKKGEILASIYM